ncbi:MAG TPA: FKBP-type peptidyl-prolyl cis-trans isomerase [Actinomycetota bacterium]|jgi:FKBP-type peptidyl-prolyl cis-trans isomerase|nr:FKBP-type peptidyl-prolyl cis-trans isomerase [Actinomycetota bacterium]
MPNSIRAFVALCALLLAAAACGGDETGGSATGSSDCRPGHTERFESGLEVTDIECGDGKQAKEGDLLSVSYVGRLKSGKVFDASRRHGGPFQFVLGAGGVIPGWDVGLRGMRAGGKRRLVIPPDLAYGSSGVPQAGIPPNATLVFDVTLEEVKERKGG